MKLSLYVGESRDLEGCLEAITAAEREGLHCPGCREATGRFHNPAHAQWSDPGIDDAFENVLGLVLRGLCANPSH